MMSDSRFQCSWAVAIVLLIGGCAARHDDGTLSGDETGDDPSGSDEAAAFHRPPPHRDAGVPTPDAPQPDAGNTTIGSGGGAGAAAGVISCYLEGYPSTTCAMPKHCCFNNFTAAHDGDCSSSTCGWGTLECDGPEDCAGGQHCCAHVLQDPDNGITGYKVACQASACGAAPMAEELCHPTTAAAGGNTCSNGKSCVAAADNDTDLPRSLFICQ
jgi:hypothetical protein